MDVKNDNLICVIYYKIKFSLNANDISALRPVQHDWY